MNLSELKDRIKDTPVSQVIGQYLPLNKVGKDYKTNCPWHQDSSPSFTVNDDKGLFKCWPCDIGGDAISFVQKYSHLNFKESVIDIGKKLGLPVEEAIEGKKKNPRMIMAEKVTSKAAQLYRKHALSGEYEKYNEFLEKRGLDKEIAEKFMLGYAPGKNQLLQYFQSIPDEKQKDFALKMAFELKILRKKDQSEFDSFRDRIIFPIWNEFGKVVGFSSRAVFDYQKAKYINSTESFLFKKNEILYGYNFAKSEIRKADQVILVEGQMDCISLHKNGFPNTVAISGTAIGAKAIQNIKALTKNVIFALDSDEAGYNAAIRISQLFMKEGISPKFIDFAECKDPDEFLMAHGPLAMENLIKEAKYLIDERIDRLIPKELPTLVDQKLNLLNGKNGIFEILSPLGSSLAANEKAILAAEKIGLKQDSSAIIKAFEEYLSVQKKPSFNPRKTSDILPETIQDPLPEELTNEDVAPPFTNNNMNDGVDNLDTNLTPSNTEKNLLQTLVENPFYFSCFELSEIVDFIQHPGIKKTVSDLKDLYFEVDEREFPRLVQNHMMKNDLSLEIKNIVGSGLFQFRHEEIDEKIKIKFFKDVSLNLKIDSLKTERKQLKTRHQNCDNEEQSTEVLKELVSLDKKMNDLKREKSRF